MLRWLPSRGALDEVKRIVKNLHVFRSLGFSPPIPPQKVMKPGKETTDILTPLIEEGSLWSQHLGNYSRTHLRLRFLPRSRYSPVVIPGPIAPPTRIAAG